MEQNITGRIVSLGHTFSLWIFRSKVNECNNTCLINECIRIPLICHSQKQLNNSHTITIACLLIAQQLQLIVNKLLACNKQLTRYDTVQPLLLDYRL